MANVCNYYMPWDCRLLILNRENYSKNIRHDVCNIFCLNSISFNLESICYLNFVKQISLCRLNNFICINAIKAIDNVLKILVSSSCWAIRLFNNNNNNKKEVCRFHSELIRTTYKMMSMWIDNNLSYIL